MVAPYMGAWIEIILVMLRLQVHHRSHPTWVRGLKLDNHIRYLLDDTVAPYMGAWIEIK